MFTYFQKESQIALGNYHFNIKLLACNDVRLPEFGMILNKSQEAYATRVPQYAESVIEKCFSTPNSNTTFEVASPSCDNELQSLEHDCQMASSPYDYCKDRRFMGHLGLAPSINNSNIAVYENATRFGNEILVPVVPQ